MPTKYIRSGPLEERFWRLVEKTDGCWLWRGDRAINGYGRLCVRYQKFRVHRLVWEMTNGPIPPGLCVCHRCDVRHCVNPNHLFLGTHGDNAKDREAKGRGRRCTGAALATTPRGETNGNHRLSASQVVEIRHLYEVGERSQESIAAEFGVHQGTVSTIIRGETWRHLLPHETPTESQ